MKSRTKKNNLLQAIYCIPLALFCLPVLASVDDASGLHYTKAKDVVWNDLADKDTGTKKFIVLGEGKTRIIKLGAGYLNANHQRSGSVLGYVIDGDVDIIRNGKTMNLRSGDLYAIPAYTCITSSSKHGVTIVVNGKELGTTQKCSSGN